MKEVIGKIKFKSSNLPRIITAINVVFLMEVKLQMNFTLYLETSRVNWQVKFQMPQQSLNPT